MTLLRTILALSILFQLLAAAQALRLMRTTGRMAAWVLISSAILLMAFRRIESLVILPTDEVVTASAYVYESIGLAISGMMFAGVSLIGPLFEAMRRSQSELRHLNEQLSALSKEQQLLLDHSSDFIYHHDVNGIITSVSPAVERITGFRRDEWLCHYMTHYTDHPENQAARQANEELAGTGQPETRYSVEVKRKGGGTVWLEVNKQPYFVDGAIAGYIGVARDVTGRKRLEQERETLIGRLQEALSNIKTLRGMLPICSSCKKVRDDKGYWNQIEAYVSDHSEAEFSHGICPECAQRLYPQYYSPGKKDT